MSILARFAAMEREGTDPASKVEIGLGTIDDYDLLAPFHYIPSPPAMVERVLIARALSASSLDNSPPVGILIVSRPTLNAPWRAQAWPRDFATANKPQAAARANALVRTISRLIVDPRWRGLGMGRRLVSAYLRAPLTPCTETLAAMGPACACFSAAGMRAWVLPRAHHDARLLAAMAQAGLEPHHLLDPVSRSRLDPAALRSWARSTRAHRALADGDLSILALRAARALASPRTAYTAGSG